MNFTFDLTITLGLIVTLLASLVAWFRTRHGAMDRRLDGVDERMGRHEQRIHSVEQVIQSMPGKDDLHGLSMAISDMRGDMREMRAAMQGQGQIMTRLEAVVSRQEDHLMRTK